MIVSVIPKDLGSSNTVKNVAFAAVTAGATAGIASAVGLDKIVNSTTLNPTSAADLASRLDYAAIQTGVNATAGSVINGTNLGDGLKTGLIAGVASAGGAWVSGVAANQLPGAQGGVLSAAIQAGVGCGAGSLGGGNCGAGAVGGAVGSVLGANGYNTDTARLAGAVGTLITGGSAADIYTAANTAETQSGVVAKSVIAYPAGAKAPDLGGQLVDGYDKAVSSKVSVLTPWGANKTIENYTGYTQTWLLGGEATAKPAGVAVVNPNNNNIGISIPMDANGNPAREPGVLDEGGSISKTLNVLPGFNNGSVAHDTFVYRTQNDNNIDSISGKLISNQGTIPLVIPYNYYGLIGQTFSPNIIQSFQPSVKK